MIAWLVGRSATGKHGRGVLLLTAAYTPGRQKTFASHLKQVKNLALFVFTFFFSFVFNDTNTLPSEVRRGEEERRGKKQEANMALKKKEGGGNHAVLKRVSTCSSQIADVITTSFCALNQTAHCPQSKKRHKSTKTAASLAADTSTAYLTAPRICLKEKKKNLANDDSLFFLFLLFFLCLCTPPFFFTNSVKRTCSQMKHDD